MNEVRYRADQAGWCCREVDFGLILSFNGELKAEAVRDALATLKRSLPGRRTNVVVDLGGVSFIDSTGLGMLISARAFIEAQGGRVVVSRMSPAVRGIVDAARVNAWFDATDERSIRAFSDEDLQLSPETVVGAAVRSRSNPGASASATPAGHGIASDRPPGHLGDRLIVFSLRGAWAVSWEHGGDVGSARTERDAWRHAKALAESERVEALLFTRRGEVRLRADFREHPRP